MAGLSFTLLGPIGAQFNKRPLTQFRTNKVQALLIYLIVEAPAVHQREMLMEMLWPDMLRKSTQVNLRQTLLQIKKLVPQAVPANGRLPADAIPILIADRKTVELHPDYPVTSDANRLAALLERTWRHNHDDLLTCPDCRAWLEAAVALYQGDFLADFSVYDSNEYEAWAQARRESFRRRTLDALDTLTQIYLAEQDYQVAEATARRQLDIDNLRENAYRQLMQVLAQTGRRSEAIALYDQCQQLLIEELGMAPAAKTTALNEQIKGGNLSLVTSHQKGIRGYELGEKLGEGAFGDVFRAHQKGIGREVAVKVIHAKYANQPNFIRRFEAEAQTVARLEHPHIVPLYDYWREPDGAYLVMRWLRGGSLQERLTAGPADLATAVTTITQIAGALHTAHTHDVVHRDVKPANILLDEEGNAYLSDFGIARDATSDLQLTRTDELLGSPAYISPEQLLGEAVSPATDIYALGLVLYELLTGARPFATDSIAELIQKQMNDPLPLVASQRPDVPAAVDQVIQRATAKQAGDRFKDTLALARALQQVVGGDDAHPVVIRPEILRAMPEGDIVNPYKGLHAFQERDAGHFYGRKRLIKQLLSRFAFAAGSENGHMSADQRGAERFLALVGPSGSGKSSVVKAGLIPALRDGALPGSEKWFIVEMTPGTYPLEELEAALLRVAVNPPPSLIEPLQKDERGLLRMLKRLLPQDRATSETSQLLLMIDQFEELFTLTQKASDRDHFLANLFAALSDAHSRLRVIVTLRADFYDRPLQQPKLGEWLRERTELVLPLRADELEEAIVAPAATMGIGVEPVMVAAMVADLKDQPGALPLMQYTLTELFERRQGRLMTLAAYEALGGVFGAIGRRAEEVFTALDADGQSAARQLFLRLVTLGEGSEDTRRRVIHSELDEIAGPEGAGLTADLLAAFGRHRLLTFDRDPVTRGPTVEVAHEALLREWPRLRGWLDESRDDIRVQRQLSQAAREWDSAAEDTSFLLRGSRLQTMASWAATTGLALTVVERRFLNAGLAEQESRKAAQATQQEREKALADRSRTVLRALVLVFGLAALIATALTLFAFNQRDDAQRVRLAAQAQTALDRGEDMVLPALLAIQSLEHAYSTEADAALLGALGRGFTLEFIGHTDSISSLAPSPDGRFVATASNDTTARLWDAQSGREIRAFSGHSGLVTQVVFSPDGKTLLTSGVDRSVRFWDVETGRELRRLPFHDTPVRALAYAPDGRSVATGDESGSLFLWDVESLNLLYELRGHEEVILSTDFSPDGRYVATGSIDTTARLWNVRTGQEVQRYEGHAASVQSVDISPDGRLLVTASSDNVARLWNVATGRPGHVLIGHNDTVADADFSPDNRQVVTSSSDTSVRLWDVATGQEVARFDRQSGRSLASDFSANGEYIISASSDPIARLWKIEKARVPRTYAMPFSTIHSTAVARVAFAADERHMLVARRDGAVITWDLETGRILEERSFSTGGQMTTMLFSPNNSLLLTGDGAGLAVLWELQSGEEVHSFVGHKGAIWSVAFAPDGRSVVTGSSDGTARLWDRATGAEIRQFIGHSSSVLAVAVAPDGHSILTGSEDGTAWLWDANTGLEIRRFIGHAGPVQAVAFAPNGQLILTGSEDGTARLWDSDTGAEIRHFIGHTDAIRVVGFIPDGERVLTGSNDSTARLWDTNSGEVVRQFTGHAGPIRTWAFSADGRQLLTAENRFVFLWQTDMAEVISTACAQLLRDFTTDERDRYGISDNEPTCEGRREVPAAIVPTWTPFPIPPVPVWTPIFESQ